MVSSLLRAAAVVAATTTAATMSLTMADPGVVSIGTMKEVKKIHFTVEFVPSVSVVKEGLAWRPYQTCSEEEVTTILQVIKDVVERDTGFDMLTDESYLPHTYGNGLHPGFDITYDCPTQCDNNNDAADAAADEKGWCDHLCMNHHTYLHHDLTTNLAQDLRVQVHSASTVSLMTKHNVHCLGDIDQVEVHLLVGTSPYIGTFK